MRHRERSLPPGPFAPVSPSGNIQFGLNESSLVAGSGNGITMDSCLTIVEKDHSSRRLRQNSTGHSIERTGNVGTAGAAADAAIGGAIVDAARARHRVAAAPVPVGSEATLVAGVTARAAAYNLVCCATPELAAIGRAGTHGVRGAGEGTGCGPVLRAALPVLVDACATAGFLVNAAFFVTPTADLRLVYGSRSHPERPTRPSVRRALAVPDTQTLVAVLAVFAAGCSVCAFAATFVGRTAFASARMFARKAEDGGRCTAREPLGQEGPRQPGCDLAHRLPPRDLLCGESLGDVIEPHAHRRIPTVLIDLG